MLSRILKYLLNPLKVVQVNSGYVVKVSELMKASLPKPRRKTNVLIGADGEKLPLITVRCEDDFRDTK